MLKLSFERAHMFNRHLFPCAPLVCLPFVSLVGELRCEESSPGRKSIPREGTADEVAQRLRTHGVGKAPNKKQKTWLEPQANSCFVQALLSHHDVKRLDL